MGRVNRCDLFAICWCSILDIYIFKQVDFPANALEFIVVHGCVMQIHI